MKKIKKKQEIEESPSKSKVKVTPKKNLYTNKPKKIIKDNKYKNFNYAKGKEITQDIILKDSDLINNTYNKIIYNNRIFNLASRNYTCQSKLTYKCVYYRTLENKLKKNEAFCKATITAIRNKINFKNCSYYFKLNHSIKCNELFNQLNSNDIKPINEIELNNIYQDKIQTNRIKINNKLEVVKKENNKDEIDNNCKDNNKLIKLNNANNNNRIKKINKDNENILNNNNRNNSKDKNNIKKDNDILINTNINKTIEKDKKFAQEANNLEQDNIKIKDVNNTIYIDTIGSIHYNDILNIKDFDNIIKNYYLNNKSKIDKPKKLIETGNKIYTGLQLKKNLY
jgi:hypothetical protein